MLIAIGTGALGVQGVYLQLIEHLDGRSQGGRRQAARTRIRALFDDPAARSGFVSGVIGKSINLLLSARVP